MSLFLQNLRRFARSPYVSIGLGLLVSGITLYLAFRDVDLKDIREVLAQADWRFVLFALVSVAINNLVKAVRWRVLLSPAPQQAGLWPVFQSHMVGQTLNNFFPARIGDLSRAYVIGGLGSGRAFTLGTVALEKVLDLLIYACLFIFLLFLIPMPPWIKDSGVFVVISTFTLALFVFLIAFQKQHLLHFAEWLRSTWLGRRLPEKAWGAVNRWLRAGLASLDVLHMRAELLRLAFWSGIIWSTAILNNQLILLALDIHLPLTASILLLIILQAGVSLPSVPGRIGIFEYLCVLTLSLYGVDQATALSYGILLHAVVLLPVTLLGVIFFWMMGLSGKRAEILKARA